jgi:succinate dehydrogenase / fumarate reductase membrane anchor subunit
MVKRTIVGAHYGLRGWLVQRVSALLMAIYTLFFFISLLLDPVHDHAAWQQLFASPWMQYATLLFAGSLLLHSWVGMRDILMDYVHPTGLRFALMVLVVLALIVYAAWAVKILWGVS